ncbi:hypothetical protein A9G11_13155 [Gilliamella sp. wkB108]|uniref:hypothetical protein n=1 Tax=Gilliamella sp. wkB108 TaxID=3120256 RepID=UPI00080E0976|nr:hypothetical protein [Gilliamella apicola]OCG27287.1 hypothetical protein A9G11_13155 [Gilliamella apicola]
MKFLKNFVIICLLILLNINIAFSANIKKELRFYQQIKLPYSSNQLKKYYYWNKFNEILISADNKTPLKFSEQNFFIQPKSVSHEDYCYHKGVFYFPIMYFKFNKFIYTGIIYMAFGNNDDHIFTFRLNSYDPDGKPIDAIVLDERYSEEGEVLVWNDFTIEANGKILVNQKEKLLIDAGLSDFKKGEIKSKKSQYQMTKMGLFKKLK